MVLWKFVGYVLFHAFPIYVNQW